MQHIAGTYDVTRNKIKFAAMLSAFFCTRLTQLSLTIIAATCYGKRDSRVLRRESTSRAKVRR